MRMQVCKHTHTVIWPTHIHTLWLARQPASFMKSFLSDAALCWTHASFWADITQSASQQLPDFSFNPSRWTESVQNTAHDASGWNYTTSPVVLHFKEIKNRCCLCRNRWKHALQDFFEPFFQTLTKNERLYKNRAAKYLLIILYTANNFTSAKENLT